MSDELAIRGQNSALKLKIDWRESVKALAKAGMHWFSNREEIGTDLVDLGASLGIAEKPTPASLAWRLIDRSLIKAMLEIARSYCEEWKQLTAEEATALNEHLSSQIPLEGAEFEIDRDFFERPQNFSGLTVAQEWMESWLSQLVENSMDAKVMSARLPSYFTCALHDELRDNRDKYQLLTTHFADTLVSDAYQREMGWRRYTAWLEKQLDEPIFTETFGIRQLYVPLRAYYVEKEETAEESSRQTKETRHACDLEAAMDEWLSDTKAPRVRLISGGPGSGKSTFTKCWAARVAAQDRFKVWHITLTHLNFTGNLESKLKDFAAKDTYLKGDPLEESNLLIIFDGLDELALSGKVGLAAAENFTEQLVTIVNDSRKNLKVLISGRDAIVQSQINKFSNPNQIWHLLPYYLPQGKVEEYHAEPQDLLSKDCRDDWWVKYGKLKGKDFTGLLDSLQLKSLEEITAQPILNYLLAISDYFLQNKIDVNTTRNLIYQSLIQKVYDRGWASQNKATATYGHPITQEIAFKDFQLVLEEVALCAWHGDGRKVTESTIVDHCYNCGKKVRDLLPYFSEKLQNTEQARITKLLTAFYFQARGEERGSGDKTFEFTHKSFGEFLTAKRLVRAIKYIDTKYRDENDGWTEKQALKHWVEVCKSGVLDFDILEFLRQEVKIKHDRDPDRVIQWQDTCCSLIGYLLRQGLPMEELGGLTYHQMNIRAIQAEITLLAMLNACAICTHKLSDIKWIDDRTFANWLLRMQAHRTYKDPRTVTIDCLSWLKLDGASLVGAHLDESNLDGASLVGVHLDGASLVGAHLDGAHLDGASLDGASLDRSNLDGSNLDGASLLGTRLVGVRLDGANLDGARLDGARLVGASLFGARLDGASLVGVRLDGASLDGASLDRSNLDGANLDGASLFGAVLYHITWSQYTNWKNVRGLELAIGVPEQLKRQLSLPEA